MTGAGSTRVVLVALLALLMIHARVTHAGLDAGGFDDRRDFSNLKTDPGGSRDDGVGELNIEKMSLSTIKTMLHQRGITCRGCVERGEFVQMLKDTIHAPVLENPGPERRARSPPSGGKRPKNGGDNMSPEDKKKLAEMLSQKLGGSVDFGEL